jgi:hypothetical protein
MIAGLFGLGGPEILVLLVIGGMCFLTVAAAVVVLIFVFGRGKNAPPPDDER